MGIYNGVYDFLNMNETAFQNHINKLVENKMKLTLEQIEEINYLSGFAYEFYRINSDKVGLTLDKEAIDHFIKQREKKETEDLYGQLESGLSNFLPKK